MTKGKPGAAAITLDHGTEQVVLDSYRTGLRTFREETTAFEFARDQLASLRPDLGGSVLSAVVRGIVERYAAPRRR